MEKLRSCRVHIHGDRVGWIRAPLRGSHDPSSPLSPAEPPCLHFYLSSQSTLDTARKKEDRTLKSHKMSDAYEREQCVPLRPS